MTDTSSQSKIPRAHDRLMEHGPSVLSDAELVTLLLGPTNSANSARTAAQALVDAEPLAKLAWASADELMQHQGIGPTRAAAISAAFELGRRSAWAPPKRSDRILDPARVAELMRPLAHHDRECFAVIMLDVRGRLIKHEVVAEGSLSMCPVSPRDALRPAVQIGAHGVIFTHNHPSGSPTPSPDDVNLTERLRAAAELVGVVARDHVIVGTEGYYSFVEAGRWRR